MSAEIAAILTLHAATEYKEGVFPDGPWAGWGWVCSCGTVLGNPNIRMVEGVPWIEQVHRLHVAEAITESLAEHDREVAEKAARIADTVGHHWSGAGSIAAFEAATQIREEFGVPAPEPDDSGVAGG